MYLFDPLKRHRCCLKDKHHQRTFHFKTNTGQAREVQILRRFSWRADRPLELMIFQAAILRQHARRGIRFCCISLDLSITLTSKPGSPKSNYNPRIGVTRRTRISTIQIPGVVVKCGSKKILNMCLRGHQWDCRLPDAQQDLFMSYSFRPRLFLVFLVSNLPMFEFLKYS
jgi:hypothetical protein